MSSESEPNPTDVPMDTPDEQIIHKLAQLRADSTRLNRLLSEADVPGELAAQLAFMSEDIDTVARETAEYIVDGDTLPDACPVCGEQVTRPADGLEADESYAVDRLCVTDQSSLGVSRSIVHYDTGDAPDLPTLTFAAEHVEPILRGKKTVTIRLTDPDELPDIGDQVRFCDESGELEAIVIEELTEPDQLALLPADTEGMTQGQWITARGDAFVAIENKR